MISIGRFPARTCQGLTRREFLRIGAAAPLALGLSAPAAAAPGRAPSTGRARSILLVWLWGGPSHLDLFDPKPHAPIEYRGPFATIRPGRRACGLPSWSRNWRRGAIGSRWSVRT